MGVFMTEEQIKQKAAIFNEKIDSGEFKREHRTNSDIRYNGTAEEEDYKKYTNYNNSPLCIEIMRKLIEG